MRLRHRDFAISKLHHFFFPRPARGHTILRAIYWPGLRDGELEPSHRGLRPKTNGLQFGDFAILADPSGRLIRLFGIEPPGLTSALALSDWVVQFVGKTNFFLL
ncbi:hypothetical protein [Mesorhizobium ciceri]|uniref:hypothetical protein n=1 Tax=Mesorhizobium ciceri TaxID=39645 RepID=UPI0013E8D824|nr:hypothetical protein [Mesorhizobium ciceri]